MEGIMSKTARNIKTKLKEFKDSYMSSRRTSRKVDKYLKQETTAQEPSTLRNEYRDGWLIQKGCKTVPKDALRNWIDIEQEDESQLKKLSDEIKRLKVGRKLVDAAIQSRIFGGAGVYINCKDSGEAQEPLEKPTFIESLEVIAYQQITGSELQTDPLAPNYGSVGMYTVNGKKVHPSRILHFEPSPIDMQHRQEHGGFSCALSHKMREEIKSFGLSNDAVQDILIDYSTKVLSIEGLIQMLTNDKSGLSERLTVLNETTSLDGLMVITEKEELKKIQTQLAGIDNLLNFILDTASAVYDMPRKKLFSQQLGTLAGAESSEKDYNATLEQYQVDIFEDHIQTMLDLINQISNGSQEPVQWTFNHVVLPTTSELAEIQTKTAQTVKNLFDAGILTDEEARKPFLGSTKQTLLKLDDLEFNRPIEGEEEEEEKKVIPPVEE